VWERVPRNYFFIFFLCNLDPVKSLPTSQYELGFKCPHAEGLNQKGEGGGTVVRLVEALVIVQKIKW